MTSRTGYDLHEGSEILAERRAEQERNLAVAEEMIRRAKVKALWRRAAFLVDMIEQGKRQAA